MSWEVGASTAPDANQAKLIQVSGCKQNKFTSILSTLGDTLDLYGHSRIWKAQKKFLIKKGVLLLSL